MGDYYPPTAEKGKEKKAAGNANLPIGHLKNAALPSGSF